MNDFVAPTWLMLLGYAVLILVAVLWAVAVIAEPYVARYVRAKVAAQAPVDPEEDDGPSDRQRLFKFLLWSREMDRMHEEHRASGEARDEARERGYP